MGMDIYAYVHSGQYEGRNVYDFAPMDPFHKIVSLFDYDRKVACFRLTSPIRQLFVRVLGVDFSQGELSFKEEQAKEAYQKLDSEQGKYLNSTDNIHPIVYQQIMEFFRICSEQKFYIAAN